MPSIDWNIGEGPVTVNAYSIKNMNEEPRVWGNRLSDFAELCGDFSWKDKPLNMEAVTLPIITPEILKKKERLEILHKAYRDFINDEISIADVKGLIAKL
jgi:DNA polymerase III epsilon subunit-like protein